MKKKISEKNNRSLKLPNSYKIIEQNNSDHQTKDKQQRENKMTQMLEPHKIWSDGTKKIRFEDLEKKKSLRVSDPTQIQRQ